jgi:hypothetical protein
VKLGDSNVIPGKLSTKTRIPDHHQCYVSTRLATATVDKSLKSNIDNPISVSSPAVPSVAKSVTYATPEATTISQSPTFDDQGLESLTSTPLLDKVVSVLPITNPCVNPTLQIPATTDTSKGVNKSNDQLLDEMMSSERGDCSPMPDLFIEDDIPVLPKQKPDRTSHAIPLFPKPVEIVAGSRRQPNRAAKCQLYTFLMNQKLKRYKG